MRRTKSFSTVIFVVALVGSTFAFSLCRAQSTFVHPAVLRFDVDWWQHAESGEQQGFIYGYLDCRQLPNAARTSIDEYQNAVSLLVKHNDGDQMTVVQAIERAALTLHSKDTRGAELYRGPHGFLDGNWWGEFPDPAPLADNDKGYLEGYFQCLSIPVTKENILHYQLAINRYYASGLHSRAYVADVFRKLLKSS